MLIQPDVSLKKYHTFGTDVYARFFVEIHSEQEFKEIQQHDVFKKNTILVLGGGSNILFTKNVDGLVIKNSLKGVEKIKEDDTHVFVKVAAGEVWHSFVLWCVAHNLGGVENLSLIPGCVGASPMQNIGAYGVEIKEVCHQVQALDMKSGELRVFSNAECEFGYRESVFKHRYKNGFFITAVVFKLNKKPVFNTSYGAIEQELKKMEITQPDIKAISKAVISIRNSKLPNPAEIGNAGSFFKNPEISKKKYEQLKEKHPNVVAYPLENEAYKLAAGWLIEQCGFKGKRIGDAGVHTQQALVLVNYGAAQGTEIYKLSQQIIEAVLNTFDVLLEREVNIY
ncbi:MAG: UDP-N-acetylmuramate dehydrogenase [Bacteroidetes bacterium]|nr:UDP-N-acetylmuramate dehydrogenase [Bacteroidota bacterium]